MKRIERPWINGPLARKFLWLEGCPIHELPLTQKIFTIVMNYAGSHGALKVVEVCLKVGEMRDFVEEVTQKYWDYIAKGSIAAEAKIRFNRVPVSALCSSCEETFAFDWRRLDQVPCPQCGCVQSTLQSGTELEIETIAILS